MTAEYLIIACGRRNFGQYPCCYKNNYDCLYFY